MARQTPGHLVASISERLRLSSGHQVSDFYIIGPQLHDPVTWYNITHAGDTTGNFGNVSAGVSVFQSRSSTKTVVSPCNIAFGLFLNASLGSSLYFG